MFDDAEIIHAYSRADAIADGSLVDVSKVASEAGFRYPVAMTRTAWATTVEWNDAIESAKPGFTGQDEAGRLWDVVFMGAHAFRAYAGRAKAEGTDGGGPVTLLYTLHVVPRDGRGITPKLATLRLSLDGGDDGCGAFLISLPEDDL